MIEGDQIEVAAFSLESFAYLTWLVTANNNAGSNTARSYIAKRQEAWFDLNQSACSGAITASVTIGYDQTIQICKRLKRKSSYFNLVTSDKYLNYVSDFLETLLLANVRYFLIDSLDETHCVHSLSR